MSKEKDGSWFKRHKKLSVVLGILLLLFIVGSVTGGSKTNNNGSSGNSSKSSEKTYRFNERADKQTKDIEIATGESGTLDGVKLTVSSVEYKTSAGEYDNAASGKTYIMVAVNIENTSDRTKPYNPYDFRVQTAGGQVLDPTIVSTPTLNSGDLVTGGKISGIVAFEVPVEEGHQYLIWKTGYASDRVIAQLK